MLKGFSCNRCGACCRSPRLYPEDVRRILDLGNRKQDFVQKDIRGRSYMQEKDGWCIFLAKKGKKASCKIYPFRPNICRQYPSELRNGSCTPETLASDKLFTK